MAESAKPPASTSAGSATKTSDAASPCISVCTLDAGARVCLGCYRTIDEIAAWSTLDDDEKRAVNARLAARRREHEERHGKR